MARDSILPHPCARRAPWSRDSKGEYSSAGAVSESRQSTVGLLSCGAATTTETGGVAAAGLFRFLSSGYVGGEALRPWSAMLSLTEHIASMLREQGTVLTKESSHA